MKNRTITVALAGNPNSGKTTIFNTLTGSRQHVGNYPGVTVEKKEGNFEYKGYQINIVDLPGTYSLTAHSIDEIIARNFLTQEKPDIVVDIIDSSNLERNLYLTTQFIELNVPLILSFNMYDIAQKKGFAIDKDELSKLFSSPIVFTVATKKKGISVLLDEIIKYVEDKRSRERVSVGYGVEIQEELDKIEGFIKPDAQFTNEYSTHWLALKLLENDEDIIDKVKSSRYSEQILSQMEKSAKYLTSIFGDSPEALIAEHRYGFISGACSEAVVRSYELPHTTSDHIDRILVNRVVGLPIFFGIVWLVFKFTFSLSKPIMLWIELCQNWLADTLAGFLPQGSALQGFITDAIIGGVGSVIVFVPVIFLLFLAMAVLEDSGYMARAAFIMDKFMHKIGLHGRSFIPMLLGFGCNVPAIMATRSIEDDRDRLVTILVTPFISCGARLPIYVLFIGAFFSTKVAGNMLFFIYIIGLTVAVLMAKIFRKYVFKGEAAPFVMELPPYRLPTLKSLLVHSCSRVYTYLKKAGTVIFAGCAIMWFLSNFPWNPVYSKDYKVIIKAAYQKQWPSEKARDNWIAKLKSQMASEKLEKSYAGNIGKVITPILKPLGFDDWKVAVALLGGIVAKEIIIGIFGTLYAVGHVDNVSEALRDKLQNAVSPNGSKLFTPLVAFTFMVFVLLYVPCIPALVIIGRESGSWWWSVFAVFYTTAIAWCICFVIYQGGKLLCLN